MAAKDKPQSTVTCPHCDQPVSPECKTCPHCGGSTPPQPTERPPSPSTTNSPANDDQWLDRILEDYD
jgi:hypothetical protein